MSIVTIISSNLNKCVSCKFYKPAEDTWLIGKCESETTQVKSRNRYHNSKRCASYRHEQKDFSAHLIAEGQKLKEGDWCVDMTDFERLELCHEFGVTYMPDKIILFREHYGIFNAKHWITKCKTQYNFADFKKLCENTFKQ